MDPSYVSSEEEDDPNAAMAAMMGFSSFGTQPSAKKRKFNPKTDAMVDGDDLIALDKGGKKGQGSGGNMIPLGRPRVLGVPAAQQQAHRSNEEEIDLDDDDNNDEGGVPIAVERLVGGDAAAEEEEEGPQYIDTSRPPPNTEAIATQQKIDAILAEHTSKPPDPGVEQQQGFQPAVENPRERNQRPRERGQMNELWYVDYYDPSFNENPWKRLEEANGLEPRGTWVERDGQR